MTLYLFLSIFLGVTCCKEITTTVGTSEMGWGWEGFSSTSPSPTLALPAQPPCLLEVVVVRGCNYDNTQIHDKWRYPITCPDISSYRLKWSLQSLNKAMESVESC